MYLVQAAGVTVEEHSHILLKNLLRLYLRQLVFAALYSLS